MQIGLEKIIEQVKNLDVFDVRTELHRSGDSIILLRMVITSAEPGSVDEQSVADYGPIIFDRRHMKGSEIVSLLHALSNRNAISFEVKGVCTEVSSIWSPKEFQYEFQKLARGQWYGFQRRNYPAKFYQSYQDIDKICPLERNQVLNAPGLPCFPSLDEAETYYLFDSVLETTNPVRRGLQFVIDDRRAWIERIIISNTGLKLSVGGNMAHSCEVKLFGKRPGFVRVAPVLEAVELGISLETLPAELNVYLSLNDEIVDQRFISEHALLYAPTQGVTYVQDEQVSIEGIIRLRGEGMHLDFKETFTPKILDTVCAFANSEGGSILIGVDDDGNIVGVENPDDVRLRIEDALEDRVVGTIKRRYYFHKLLDSEGREVVVIQLQVDEAPTKPVALRERDREKYYIRRDGSNRLMKRDDFVHMINQAIMTEGRKQSLFDNPLF